MTLETVSELREAATTAARIGGMHAMANLNRRRDILETHAHDIKLALDRECQEQITAYLTQRYPHHAILGEEDIPSPAPRTSDSQVEWIIDPIDGTVNFSHGLPMWCCSVAVRSGSTILAGAVFAPELGTLSSGGRGQASTCNDRVIQVTSTADLSQSIVMTGIDKNIHGAERPFAIFSALALATRKVRVAGAAAVDLCWVAAGNVDGYFEGSIYIWDIAAAKVIIEGAGGRCEIVRWLGEPNQLQFVASNGHIHEPLKACLATAGIRSAITNW